MDKQTVGTLSTQALLTQLHTSDRGLTRAEATARGQKEGPNALAKERHTALRILLRQFQSPLIYLLIGAAVVSFATGDNSDGTIITAILLINALLGFVQEYRSERAIEQLSNLISNKTLVKRDGADQVVDVATLVPGDLVILKEGDVVPADIRLLTTDNVQVDESQLTGESLPVTKMAPPVDAAGGDSALVFAGSTLDDGAATGVVYAIGNQTQLGKIATLSTSIHKVTTYEQSLQQFSTLLMKIVAASLLVTLVIKIAIAGTTDIPLMLTFLIALAVAVVPEALPVITTVTLSRGALQLAREQVVVKRLSALEDLGHVTLLCTDKTGTLTEGRLTIQRLVTSDDTLFERLAIASATSTDGQAGTQSAFNAAFAAYVPADIKRQAASLRLVKELPFDPQARRRRVVLTDSATGQTYLVVIGSAETLLQIAHCAEPAQYQDLIATEGRQGLRHLAIAYKELPSPVAPGGQGGSTQPAATMDSIAAQEADLTFLGLATLADPLRASTSQTIATAEQLGVAIKILTGDSKEVAGYVAQQVGLIGDGGLVYTGDDLDKMAPEALKSAVAACNVFARVTPEQKFAIIQALKGPYVVGYQGDGINDAPALKLADVGIAVDSATDVAKANADIILLNKDLGVIVHGIEAGRATFVNINKYIAYTMVGNFGNFIALALLYLLAATLPLLPRQVLLISLLTDLPLVTVSTDTVDSADLASPPHNNVAELLNISLVLGSLTALFELAFFATLRGEAASAAQTSLYLFFSLTQLIVIVSVRNRDHFWKASRPSVPLTAAMLLTTAVAVALPYLPVTAQVFSFSPLPFAEIGRILLIAALYILVLDVVKVWYFRAAAKGWTLGSWFRRKHPVPSGR